MPQRTLAEWLRWQETLNPLEIDLGLDRVRQVAARLELQPPVNAVFLVAGTNGKGSVVSALHHLCHEQGLVTGTYTSPHLNRYNERICVAGKSVSDTQLVNAFDAIEAVRGDLPLTYFEYGTLAAFYILSRAAVDVWIIEVGLGGRLDATNVIEPNFSLITTIDFDHQAFLGNTLDAIATEKAGIFRAAGHGFYGGREVPFAIANVARKLNLQLQRQGHEFGFDAALDSWTFRAADVQLDGLPLPPANPEIQLQNQSLALAAVAAWRPELLDNASAVRRALEGSIPAGRFQLHNTKQAGGVLKSLEWVLDVAHNPQALRALRANLMTLPCKPLTVVLGMLADKDVSGIPATFRNLVDHWIVTGVPGERGQSAQSLADRLAAVGIAAEVEPEPVAALRRAVAATPDDGRVLVFGSFFIVGPAMQWLGM